MSQRPDSFLTPSGGLWSYGPLSHSDAVWIRGRLDGWWEVSGRYQTDMSWARPASDLWDKFPGLLGARPKP